MDESGGFRVSCEHDSQTFPTNKRGPTPEVLFLNKELQRAHTFGCISVPNGMELISTELFLIRDGPLGGASVCGPWTGTGTGKEPSVPSSASLTVAQE